MQKEVAIERRKVQHEAVALSRPVGQTAGHDRRRRAKAGDLPSAKANNLGCRVTLPCLQHGLADGQRRPLCLMIDSR